MIDGSCTPRVAEHVVSQEAGGQAVVLQLENGEYFSLDDVGTHVWRLCDGSRNVVQIAAAICSKFDADTLTVERDVRELIEELERHKLVSLV